MNSRVDSSAYQTNSDRKTQPALRPIFVGGCERSGTTLLGSLLGAAPATLTIPESRFRINALIDSSRTREPLSGKDFVRLMTEDSLFRLWSMEPPSDHSGLETYRDAVESIVWAYAREQERGRPTVWVDHTPINVRYAVKMAEHFPDAKYVHIIRDGRAVCASLLGLDWGPNTAVNAARHWRDRIALGLALETSRLGPSVMRVHYEDLVSNTETTLRELCEFCEIDFHQQMLEGGRFAVPPHMKVQNQLVGKVPEAKRAFGWRERLSHREIEIFEAVAGELLHYLGYTPMFGLSARPATMSEERHSSLIEWYRNKIVNKPRKKRRLALARVV